MEINSPTFYLLDSLAGWRAAGAAGVSFSSEVDGCACCLEKEPRAIKDNMGTFGGLDLPTGIAVDHYGNIYMVDTEGNVILKYDLCREFPLPLPCLGGQGKGPREFDAPKGIVISPSGNLYVSDSNNHRVMVFSLKGLVLRETWGKKDDDGQPVPGTEEGEFNTPWDIAIDSKGHVYVVDKGNNRVQKFTGSGEFIGTFGSSELSNPEHIAIDILDKVYVTDSKEMVKVYSAGGEYLGEMEYRDSAAKDFETPAVVVDSAGRIHNKKFYGVQGRFFKRAPGRRRQEEQEEVIIPGVIYNNSKLSFGTGNLPGPVEDAAVYLKEGTYYTEALDSNLYKCQWHKILLEADIPLGTGITVETYTSESRQDILEVKALPGHLWQTRQLNAENFLVQGLPGRYLWLKITFKGNGKATPVIKRIRVYYPRESYLQYLPAIYQEEPVSKWFLERFLSLFEHFFSGFEEEIAGIARYFNPASTREEFLSWLASWLGLVLEEKLPVETKRELIKQAHLLFNMKGTLKGLQKVLEIYTGMTFPILEHFKMRRWLILGEDAVLGCDSLLWGNEASLGESTELGRFKLGNADEPQPDPFNIHVHRFTLFIPYHFCGSEEKERLIKQVVELWKPAHTQFFLRKVKPAFRVGLQSMIGVDTIIAKYPQAVLGLTSRLGKESILSGSPAESGAPNLRIGDTSYVGDMVIN